MVHSEQLIMSYLCMPEMMETRGNYYARQWQTNGYIVQNGVVYHADEVQFVYADN